MEHHYWDFKPLSKAQQGLAGRLASGEKLQPVIGEILVRRGLKTPEDVHGFLFPKLDQLHDPFLMPDMDKAIKRLNAAIGNKERIMVYGDFDVDGTTAVTLVYKFLRQFTQNIDYYIPDRSDEGSGISQAGVDFATGTGCRLMIVLDTGIKNTEMVSYAKERGLDIIVCDHHNPGEQLPDASANLNPRNKGSKYPYKYLSGCGVGFKLMQAFALSNDISMQKVYDLLDLVAVSIAADLVPLTGENRVLAYYGMRKLNKTPLLGLKGIIAVSGLENKELTLKDIILKIGPRLNASGRIRSGRESVDLLLSSNEEDAHILSRHLDDYNNQRRDLDRFVTQEANDIVESFTDLENHKVIIVYDPSWHSGVIGIVASRLSEKYNRPAIVLADTQDNLVGGSARSIDGYDVYSILEHSKDLLENFGGHTHAAGLSIKKKNLHRFIQQSTALAERNISSEDLRPSYRVDAEISLKQIVPTLKRQIRRLSPFGPRNESPIFLTRGVVNVTPPRVMGFRKNHLKLVISMPDQLPILQGTAYNRATLLADFAEGQKFDILYTIDESNKGDSRSIYLNILDIHFPEKAGEGL
ncbi:MAG: single-stranded-DNA-specific exonuclease RecJ [Bacteroidales bacterium]|nr:single-stranded-DNA-specific exonuclease RecJ [Bacteroidales bacterium]